MKNKSIYIAAVLPPLALFLRTFSASPFRFYCLAAHHFLQLFGVPSTLYGDL